MPHKPRIGFLAPAFALVLVALAAMPVLAMGERAGADGSNPPTYRLTPPGSSCMVGGCSGQLCVDDSQGDMLTTCEWAAHYACYQNHGECKRQPSGECGWTQTPALTHCLKNPPGIESQPAL
jgi:hypothetical protein